MKSQRLLIQYLFACILLLAALGLPSDQASTATCTWQGGNGDWATPTNWSCGWVPTTGDDVVIDQAGVGPQINAATTGIDVNSISIGSGALLTVNATTNSLTAYVNSFTNSGEIIINGDNASGGGLTVWSPFANNGTVTISTGGINLVRGGTHTGDFVGAEHTVLAIGNSSWPDQTFTFTDTSQIQVPIILVNGSPVVNIAGDFTPGLVSLTPNESYLSIFGGTFNLTTTSVFLPYKVSTSNATLNLPITPLDVFELTINGTLSNPAQLQIMEKLQLVSANLSGVGQILVDSQASTFTLSGTCTLGGGKTLSNCSTANWNSGSVTLANGASFTNYGTFNANNNTVMGGTATAAFVNNGNFLKKTAGTTTTMNIPFTNNGTVDIVAGNLIFQQGMDNGENAVIDLGNGTLDPGDTLNLAIGDSLIGSGTLAANLVNAGTVSPGESPGGITVQGDYTQSADGILDIELSGTTAGTQYDQLTVTGTASMAGTLNVSLIDGFIPQVGNSFTILSYSMHLGEFPTLNLPEGYQWGYEYTTSGVILTILGGGSISGTVTCNSPHTVFVDLWVDDYNSPPPQDSINIACGESYSFTDVPDGTYYVGAWIDLNESGSGPPDEGEPYAWYGSPSAVTIVDGETRENIDITIEGGGSYIFLPLILR